MRILLASLAVALAGSGKLRFLAELVPGTRILLGSGASIAVAYASTGSEFTLEGPGEYLVTAVEVRVEKGAPPKRRVVPAIADPAVVARVSRSATASLRMRGVPVPAPIARDTLEYPVDTRVATLQPPLRWRAEPGGAPVTVSLADASGNEVWKGDARPGGAAPVKLSPATRYTWTVMTPGGVIGEARFETLPAAAMAKVAKSQGRMRSFADRVMHALLLQEIGASQDARAAWAALARERPDLPELDLLAK
jgi:hypothetical protein